MLAHHGRLTEAETVGVHLTQERGADAFHGTGGPLKVTDHRWQPSLARAMHDAAVEAGFMRGYSLVDAMFQ